MKLSDIKPLEALKSALEEHGVIQKIYIGNKPTTGLPNEYIELYQNGGLKTKLSKMGMVQGYVMISINVKLLSTGGRNTIREGIILSAFDGLFENANVVNKDSYTFSLELNNMVYSGGGIYEGYSTKLINLTFNKA